MNLMVRDEVGVGAVLAGGCLNLPWLHPDACSGFAGPPGGTGQVLCLTGNKQQGRFRA
jgi:hypothetical protein